MLLLLPTLLLVSAGGQLSATLDPAPADRLEAVQDFLETVLGDKQAGDCTIINVGYYSLRVLLNMATSRYSYSPCTTAVYSTARYSVFQYI